MTNRILCAAALALACAVPAAAQLRQESAARFAGGPYVDWTSRNAFGMEPYAGVYLDGMVPDNDREMGPLVGVRLTYEPMYRLRFLIDVGYSEVSGVGIVSSGASTFTHGSDWIFTLAGLEFDVVPGNTAGLITLAGGVAWREIEVERRITGADADPDLGGFTSMVTIAPGIALAHALSERGAVRFGIQDFIVDVDENAEHSPAFTLGVVFR